MNNGLFTKHAEVRQMQRLPDIDKKIIEKHIRSGKPIMYAKKASASKSIAYIVLNDETPIKLVINRNSKKVVTIIPIDYAFNKRFRFHSVKYDDMDYLVEIFPDAYIETGNKCLFTKITQIDGYKNEMEIKYNHPFFEGLFNFAWFNYQNMKERRNSDKASFVEKNIVSINYETSSEDCG